MRTVIKKGITVTKAGFTASVVLLGTLVTSGGCSDPEDAPPGDDPPPMEDAGVPDPDKEVTNGYYHRVSRAAEGVSITFKRHATNAMIAAFDVCQSAGGNPSSCGTITLRLARELVILKLSGPALELWNGNYAVWGYSPNIGDSFRDEKGPDFATAVQDFVPRSSDCLRIDWKPADAKWTSVGETDNECEWGESL